MRTDRLVVWPAGGTRLESRRRAVLRPGGARSSYAGGRGLLGRAARRPGAGCKRGGRPVVSLPGALLLGVALLLIGPAAELAARGSQEEPVRQEQTVPDSELPATVTRVGVLHRTGPAETSRPVLRTENGTNFSLPEQSPLPMDNGTERPWLELVGARLEISGVVNTEAAFPGTDAFLEPWEVTVIDPPPERELPERDLPEGESADE